MQAHAVVFHDESEITEENKLRYLAEVFGGKKVNSEDYYVARLRDGRYFVEASIEKQRQTMQLLADKDMALEIEQTYTIQNPNGFNILTGESGNIEREGMIFHDDVVTQLLLEDIVQRNERIAKAAAEKTWVEKTRQEVLKEAAANQPIKHGGKVITGLSREGFLYSKTEPRVTHR